MSKLRQHEVVALLAQRVGDLQRSGGTVVIAFGGEGNCHKTTITLLLCEYLARSGINATFLEIDSFARDRGERFREGISGYDPHSFDSASFHRALMLLADGKPVAVPYYDHQTGRSCLNATCEEHPHEVQPGRVVVAVGLFFTIQPDALRPELRIFFRSRGRGKLISRLRRDIRNRGYPPTTALINYVRMRRDYRRWMQPAITDCDWVIDVDGSTYKLRFRRGAMA
ncbi:uridine kinase family protein [Streptomyces sp. bgisy027]|uniref:uridine kinase family protein n=1 Tax=Streptomyces sp. bgisy027 TaxID=3413770 RepID=UPI003D724F56